MASLVLGFESADGFEFLGREGEKLSEAAGPSGWHFVIATANRPTGVGNIAPDRMAFGFTGRLFFVDPIAASRTDRG